MANYLYNGVELPALPEWDTVAYPYACIAAASSEMEKVPIAALYVSNVPIYMKAYSASGGFLYLKDSGTISEYWYDSTLGDTDFSLSETNEENAGLLMGMATDIIWSNYDLLNYSDDTLYLEASCPIDAETGEEYHGWCIHATAEPIDPTSFLQGWLVGRRLAGMRK